MHSLIVRVSNYVTLSIVTGKACPLSVPSSPQSKKLRYPGVSKSQSADNVHSSRLVFADTQRSTHTQLAFRSPS